MGTAMLSRLLFQISVAHHLDHDTSQLVMATFLEGLDYDPLAHVVSPRNEGRSIGELLKLLEIERHDTEVRHTLIGVESRTERFGVHPLGTVQDVKCTEPELPLL